MRKSQTHGLWYRLIVFLLASMAWNSLHACQQVEAEAWNKYSALSIWLGVERTEKPDSIRTDSLMKVSTNNPAKLPADSPAVLSDTSNVRQIADSLAHTYTSRSYSKLKKTQMFVPNPSRALWLSLVFPGAGQIYNRKYWKLPIIYGGFLGCTYALMWNQMMYRDYSQAYLDIMDDDPDTHSYLDMLPPRYDITGREEQFKKIFKRKKDFYRRYRDLSAFCFVGVYLLSVVDAYVDAQLSVFDISPDLSLQVQPATIGGPPMLGTRTPSAYGIGCSLRF